MIAGVHTYCPKPVVIVNELGKVLDKLFGGIAQGYQPERQLRAVSPQAVKFGPKWFVSNSLGLLTRSYAIK